MTAEPSDALATRLGYLLKHAQQRLVLAAAPALAKYGIDGRELAVLTVLAADYPLSQQEAGERLGVDRTTMVALLDDLEAKGLVERHRSIEDRRKNIVQLTDAGKRCLDGAGRARDEVEREYLAPLGDKLGQQFIRALQVLAGVRPD
ncbi:MAG TPA: MarR family transcriptional regulator [Streptosporangiaceae bacterium]|nr:MarR family transcriptional regulator [Streptosporangiaceae bacterium]